MSTLKNKQKLPQELAKLIIKLSSLFFQKLVLLEDEVEQKTRVKSYDHQCEGAQMIVGFLKTKHQNVVLKTFTALRDYRPSETPLSRPATQKAINGITTRTYLNSTFTVSEYGPTRQTPINTVRSLKDDNTSLLLRGSKSAVNLSKLLKRVKQINSSNQSNYSFMDGTHSRYETDLRQNSSYCLNCGAQSGIRPTFQKYLEIPGGMRIRTNPTLSAHMPASRCSNQTAYLGQTPKSFKSGQQMLVKKTNRRQFILDKLHRIQGNLIQLGTCKSANAKGKIFGDIDHIKENLRV